MRFFSITSSKSRVKAVEVGCEQKKFETRRHEAASADTKDTKKKDMETQRHHAANAAHKGDTKIF
jgi:hypothetical protein